MNNVCARHQPMTKRIIWILIWLLPFTVIAQEEAVTSSGKVVLLFPDSTWKLKKIENVQASAGDSTQVDSLAIPKPEKVVKQYSDTTFGFKGFLKTQELKISALPEYSEGVYEYRAKVNKEGFVKEVITMKRGPNGQTDQILRNSILRFKFRPDGSIVAPLTEGTFRITVPPIK